MGFSVTKVIKIITMNLVFEQAPKIVCMLYSSITKNKIERKRKQKNMQETVFLSSLRFSVEFTSWWYMSMYKLHSFSVHIEEKKWLVHNKWFSGLSRSDLLFHQICCWNAGHVVSAVQATLGSVCSHPACKWSELVIYVQSLEDACLFSRLWVSL